MMKFKDQIRTNVLSLISLAVALYAIGYNTWRNELTEYNRNIRFSGFEMLVHVSDLQRISYLAHYDMDLKTGNPRKGWTEVLQLQDLGQLMPDLINVHTKKLLNTWETHWQKLRVSKPAIDAIDGDIKALREAILYELKQLE